MKYSQRIIQGGMGAGVSNWQLARSVSLCGQLGIVSGVALDVILARRLQCGDPGGHMRRGLNAFPEPGMVQEILDKYFIPEGKLPNEKFYTIPNISLDPCPESIKLNIVSNFVEVFLAKDGHAGSVGINYMEKIQMYNPSALYGAMLAGVDAVFVGAGIPDYFPGLISNLCLHKSIKSKLDVRNFSENFYITFNPRQFLELTTNLTPPDLFLVVSSHVLAEVLNRKIGNNFQGFIIENHIAGGHNAPPRGRNEIDKNSDLIYGERDIINLEKIRKIGKPFWIAGGFGVPGKLKNALELGANGIQAGTIFAFCKESGISENLKQRILGKIIDCDILVRTDPIISPTGFPFKVITIEDELFNDEKEEREPICDLGYLRHAYWNGENINFRCPAEPVQKYLAKNGDESDTTGKACLCNALLANIGLAQIRQNGYKEQPILTAGNTLSSIREIVMKYGSSYSSVDVISELLA